MPTITEAFTFTAAMATFVNGWFLYRCLQRGRTSRWKNLRPMLSFEEDRELKRIAKTFILVWLSILLTDLLVLVAGIGILIHYRVLGYLLALMPVGSTLAGFFALRGFYD